MKRQFPLNGSEVRMIGGDYTGPDTARGQGDQHIEGEIPYFCRVIVLTAPQAIENFRRREPMLLGRSHNTAATP